MDGDAIVDIHEAHGPLLALPQGGGQRCIHEAVDAPQHRVVRRARETIALFIGGPESEECG